MKARRATVKSLVSLKAWMLLCLVMLCAAGVKAETPYAIWCEGNSTLYFANSNETYAAGGTYNGEPITKVWSGDQVTNYGDRPQWTAVVGMNCTKVVFDQSFREVKLTSLKRWFARLFNPALQFEGLENLNTSEVTDMSYMFETANRLKNIDLSSFYTGKVTTMKGMFKDCLALTTIDLSSFNTENVTDMSQMFYYCDDLTSLDLSHFNTQKVTDMTEMFYKCQALTDLDLRSFNTENVTSMYYMFFDCEVLSNLNVSSFNTKNVTDMTYMFAICKKLTSLDLSHFDTGKVTSMNGMFGDCKTLSYLDLSNFKTDKVENMNSMFSGCNNLKTIFCNNDWNTENVTDANSMFNGCTSLVGGNGTAYDAEHIDNEYARIDREGTPGYFTSTFEYTISSATVGTLYMDYPVNIPEADYFDVYYVKSINSEGTLYLKKVKDVIPANTGVIIFGNEDSYLLHRSSEEVAAIEDNMLYGVTEETSVADLQTQHGTDIYVLSRGNDSYINFRKAGGSVKTIPANRAYLPYSTASGAKELTIAFDEEDGEATGIGNVATEKAERTGVFNLSGQRVAKPQHGIYIVNGKKVFIP